MVFDWPPFLPQQPIAVEDILHGKWAKDILALRGKVDLISGGPPCQGFSFSGKRQQNDPRNRLIEAYADVVLKLKPKLLLIENVPGILVPHGKKQRQKATSPELKRLANSYAERLSELLSPEYLFVRNTFNAAEMGVPQSRKRFFGIGILKEFAGEGITVDNNQIYEQIGERFVVSERLDPFLNLQRLRNRFLEVKGLSANGTTVAEAIGDFLNFRANAPRNCQDDESPSGFLEIAYDPPAPYKQNKFVKLMRAGMNGQVPDSLRLARHSELVTTRFAQILANCPRGVRLNDKNRDIYSTLKNRIVPLHPDQPGHTVTTLPDDLLHYSEPRILTVRECARLQSFPDWFVLKGKYTTGGKRRRKECPRYTQIGNAVPPLLAEAWGWVLREILQSLAIRATAASRA